MVRISTPLNALTYLVCLLGTAPLYPYLDLPVQIALPAALGVGILFESRQSYPLRGRAATLLALACFLPYAVQISRTNLIDPVVNTLALLLAVRLVTEKSGRNYLQVFVLALFALASSSLLTLEAAFFLYLVLLVAAVTIGLVLLSFFAADPHLRIGRGQLKKILRVSALLPGVSLVLMMLFFVILPRTQRPLWNFLNPSDVATSGFSDKVQPGAFAQSAAVKTVAFRAESERLARDDLYWRGIVLNALEGNTWVRHPLPAGESDRLRGGRSVPQTVFPEPKTDPHLVALDLPRSIKGMRVRVSSDQVFASRGTIDRRARFEAVSILGGDLMGGKDLDRDFYLRVAQPASARVAAVAESLRKKGGNASAVIADLKDFFREQRLQYATTDLPTSTDPVAEFLFEKKRGYCEYFASSFALLLRLSGVPARLVGGYFGGEYNELGGYYLVTEDTAHVWVEALDEQHTWVRIDPSTLAQNGAAAISASRGRGLGPVQRVADAIDYFWNQAVIGYDLGRQLDLLRRTNLQFRDIRLSQDLPEVLGAALGLALLAAGGWLLLARRRISAEERILRRYLRRMRRLYGSEAVPEGSGLYEVAQRLGDPRCREFADIFGGAVYRDRRLTSQERRRLEELIRDLRGGRGA